MFEIDIAENGEVSLSGRFDASQVEKAEAVFNMVEGECVIDCKDLRAYRHDAGVRYLDMTPVVVIVTIGFMAMRYVSCGIGEARDAGDVVRGFGVFLRVVDRVAAFRTIVKNMTYGS